MSDPTMPAGLRTVQISVSVDMAPEDEAVFDEWCQKYGCHPLNGGRRAWCPDFQSYFRDAIGVATTGNGEQFLIYADDIEAEAALAQEGTS